MQEAYEEDKIKIKEKNGRITYYSPSTKTHIIEWKREIEQEFSLKIFTDWLIKISRGNFTVIKVVSYGLTQIFYLLYIAFLFSGILFDETANEWLIPIGLIMAFICLDLTFEFPKIREYYQDTRCGNCGKYLACGESKCPEVKELSTPETYSIIETKYWKCRFCGYENIRRYELYPTKKGKISKSKVKCEKCKKNEMKEYKKPDIVEKGGTEYTTHYYKCDHCGHEETKMESKEKSGYYSDYV